MGAGLVKAVYAYAADVPLNPNEFRLLTFMALTALDADTTPRYFDSREASALALGRRVPDEECAERSAAFEAVKVATRGLVALEAIQRIRTGHRGQRAEFAIRIEIGRSRRTAEFQKRRKAQSSRTQKARPSPFGRSALPQSEDSAFPQGTTQEPPGQTEGTTTTNATTSLGPVDNSRRGAAA